MALQHQKKERNCPVIVFFFDEIYRTNQYINPVQMIAVQWSSTSTTMKYQIASVTLFAVIALITAYDFNDPFFSKLEHFCLIYSKINYHYRSASR